MIVEIINEFNDNHTIITSSSSNNNNNNNNNNNRSIDIVLVSNYNESHN